MFLEFSEADLNDMDVIMDGILELESRDHPPHPDLGLGLDEISQDDMDIPF